MAGKTALLTSIAANLLALSAGRLALPVLSDRLRGRRLSVAIAPAGASGIPRFEVEPHTAALAADPPRWPARTTAVSLLALDVDVPREGLLAPLGPQRRRLEFLDYPGEWLLDLPLLSQDFTDWSEATLRRLEASLLRVSVGTSQLSCDASLVCHMARRRPPYSRLPPFGALRMWLKRWPAGRFRPSAAASLESLDLRASIRVKFLTACRTTRFGSTASSLCPSSSRCGCMKRAVVVFLSWGWMHC